MDRKRVNSSKLRSVGYDEKSRTLEVEMYNVTADPMELDNLAGKAEWKERETQLRQLLAEQCAKKRLTPSSGAVPGETACRRA